MATWDEILAGAGVPPSQRKRLEARIRSGEARQELQGKAISAAVAAGKISPARRAEWEAKMEADPVGTTTLLDQVHGFDPEYMASVRTLAAAAAEEAARPYDPAVLSPAEREGVRRNDVIPSTHIAPDAAPTQLMGEVGPQDYPESWKRLNGIKAPSTLGPGSITHGL